ncbi:hypothetical protein DF196_09575 [Bifidobacterium callitrichidarum]|uniref:Uncharacterized protein n=1 Tax=Bifidobacterium callitrichidarum TaxID=2052941 RepID=A0A2U2N505_9BIFI|nr:hypothetical protein DF196_09575 [Bifidobacterium callitrichidarum]
MMLMMGGFISIIVSMRQWGVMGCGERVWGQYQAMRRPVRDSTATRRSCASPKLMQQRVKE